MKLNFYLHFSSTRAYIEPKLQPLDFLQLRDSNDSIIELVILFLEMLCLSLIQHKN